MAEQAVSEPLLIFFQIVPFLFSILLRLSSPSFDSEWEKELGKYGSALGYDVAGGANSDGETDSKGDANSDEDVDKWKYKHITTYFYDKNSLESGLRLSLFYAAVLHILAIYRSSEGWLAAPTVALIALGFFLPNISDRFFQMGAEERNPDRYYAYYYVGNNPSTKTREVFENRILSSWSQMLTPRLTAVLIEGALLVSIVLLQILPKSTAVCTSSILVVFVLVLGILLFPLRLS